QGSTIVCQGSTIVCQGSTIVCQGSTIGSGSAAPEAVPGGGEGGRGSRRAVGGRGGALVAGPE
ncbi:MAG: hypothetical protein JXA93_11190, partial [Anaerolineae bacterium]|nr:hypothetical protein [Anaerolineae bacterium]